MRCLPSIALLTALAGCEVPGADLVHDPLDYEEIEAGDGKADGVLSAFHASRVVSDDAFFHVDAMSAAEVQGFLERTPYGRRSFLAGERLASGELLSAALIRVAREHELSPLVLLVTLQKEAGLVSASSAPSRQRVDYAFGCGCPDGRGCSSAYRGLDKQLDCAADRLRAFADDLEGGGATISGWKPGRPKRALDGVSVTPANRATAVLYTYTPWILRGTGGNWLFWNIWKRYSTHLGYARGLHPPFNEGFIGGACADDLDCFYDGGLCQGGTCSKACASTCPDRAGGFATTFCVTGGDGAGHCVARCDEAVSDTGTGCGDGQACVPRTRHSDASVSREVCLPE